MRKAILLILATIFLFSCKTSRPDKADENLSKEAAFHIFIKKLKPIQLPYILEKW